MTATAQFIHLDTANAWLVKPNLHFESGTMYRFCDCNEQGQLTQCHPTQAVFTINPQGYISNVQINMPSNSDLHRQLRHRMMQAKINPVFIEQILQQHPHTDRIQAYVSIESRDIDTSYLPTAQCQAIRQALSLTQSQDTPENTSQNHQDQIPSAQTP